MATFETTEEAIAFIEKTIKEWIKNGQPNKVISLATFAERWNSKYGGTGAKIKDLKKDIKDLERVIKRGLSRGRDTDFLEDVLGDMKKERDGLEKDYTPIIRNVKTGKIEGKK